MNTISGIVSFGDGVFSVMLRMNAMSRLPITPPSPPEKHSE